MSSRVLLRCTALHRHLLFFYFFILSSYMGRLPPAPKLPPPGKPGSRAGHDIETPTGLGTHKSARACYVPASTSAEEPALANLFWRLLISHLSPLPALHCTPCTHPLTLAATTGALRE